MTNSIPAKVASVVVVAVALAASTGLLRISIDNRLERWIDPRGESAVRYDAFKDLFGNDEFAVIAYRGPDVFDVAALDTQLDVLEAVEALPMVTRVFSVASVYRDNFGAEDPEELRRDFLETPFYRRFLISDSGDMAAYFLRVDPADTPDARTQLVQELESASAPLRALGFDVYLAGSPVINAAMDEVSFDEASTTFPIAFVISVLVLMALLRSVRGTLIAIACATLTTTATVGAMAYVGVPLNMMSSVMPALLWVLALANPVHLIRRYQREVGQSGDARRAMADAFRATALPCALSSLTTAAGFLSLTFADLSPVRECGGFAAAGFTLSLALSFAIVPWAVVRLGASRHAHKVRGVAGRLIEAVHAVHAYPKAIVGAAVLVTVGAAFCVPRIRIDANPLTFFDDDTEIVHAYKEIGDALSGAYSLEVVIETPDGWLDEGAWSVLDRFETTMADTPGVTRVLSPIDLLKKANQWDHDFAPDAYRLPESTDEATELIQEFGPAEDEFLAQLVSDDGKTVRLTVLGHKMLNSDLFRIQDAAERELAALPPGFSAYTTGLVPHILQSHSTLIATQIRTIAAAFGVVFVCILIGLRSFRLTLLSIPPNLIPVLAALAVMGVAGIYLDVATVMTASVVLGIAVDDTVHMLTAYRRQRESGAIPGDAWSATLEEVGPAIVVTTVTAFAAFAALSFAGFVPLRHFGQLACLAIAVAFVADVVLLPALAMALTPGQTAE